MSRAFRLGIFIVTTLVILAAGVFLIGDKRFLFRRTYQLSADFQDVDGLANGADVQVGGIHMGTVKRIQLPDQPSGKLTVLMDLSDSTKNIVRKDSVASIKTEGLLGDKYIEISFGSGNAANIENGDTIKGEQPKDFANAAVTATNQATETAAAFKQDADALKSNFLLRGFFQRRGYQDPSDLKKNLIPKLPSQQASKKFVYDPKNIFDRSNDAKLKDAKSLNEAGQFLQTNKFKMAVVAASDNVGDTGQDRTLTEARAKVVRDYLVQNFQFDDTRLKIIGLGKSLKGEDASRVEILVYD
jgi:outer membrane protein OmpA-like peptidoglycan-associated protein